MQKQVDVIANIKESTHPSQSLNSEQTAAAAKT